MVVLHSPYMIPVNDPFLCQQCGFQNVKALRSYRNHCRRCLFSLHVDDQIPGDRLSSCNALMEPISARVHAKKEYEILHECQQCGKKITNKAASDDDVEKIIHLSVNPFSYVSRSKKKS